MNNKIKIVLQKRDINILKFVSDMDFVPSKSLKEVFFNDKSLSACKKRLWNLKRSEYLKLIESPKGERLYQVTNNGLKVVQNEFCEELIIEPSKSINFDTLEHSIGITKIRTILESKLSIIKWTVDRSLEFQSKSEGSRVYVPDSLIKLDSGQILVLEYERVQKTKARIEQRILEVEKIMGDFFANSKDAFGLIVCRGKRIKELYNERNINKNIKIVLLSELACFKFNEAYEW